MATTRLQLTKIYTIVNVNVVLNINIATEISGVYLNTTNETAVNSLSNHTLLSIL